jgi:hypothetical protein
MHRVLSALRLVVTVVAIAAAVEAGYRFYLYFKHPDYFATTDIDAAEFPVLSNSFWRYDPDYGYSYIPSLKVDVTSLKHGAVTQCSEIVSINEQGNFGPPVPDFDEADVRIVMFGDSFLRGDVDGPAWTKMMGEKLEVGLGKTVRVLNLGRDGYGLPQMMALANSKLRVVRPSLVIFAFQGAALERGRYWRAVVGTGDDMRVYSTLENSPNPNPDYAADTFMVLPSASRSWCEEQLKKSRDEQRRDPILQKLLAKHREIALKNGAAKVDLFDLKASYVYGLLRYRSPFQAQWGKLPPSTNPQVTYDDYREDPRFMADLAGVMESGVPCIFVHLAVGKSIGEGREFDLDDRSRKLMSSLRNITGKEIYKTIDFISLPRQDAPKMCAAPNDCHPSEFGMEIYARAVADMVLKSGFR